MTKRSERAGARRKVLAQLKEIKDRIKILDAWWNVSGRIYDEYRPINERLRERRPEEYPEAQRRYWAGTIAAIDAMQIRIDELRKYCLNEYHATPETEYERVKRGHG